MGHVTFYIHTQYAYRRKMRKKDGPETFSSGKLRFENFQGLTLVRNQAIAYPVIDSEKSKFLTLLSHGQIKEERIIVREKFIFYKEFVKKFLTAPLYVILCISPVQPSKGLFGEYAYDRGREEDEEEAHQVDQRPFSATRLIRSLHFQMRSISISNTFPNSLKG